MHQIKIPKSSPYQTGWIKKVFQLKTLLLVLGVLILVFTWAYFNRHTNSTAKFIFKNLPIIDSGPAKVNILLLGNAGGTHDGADLTDTVMVATVDGDSKRVNLISIPRDLWLDSIKG